MSKDIVQQTRKVVSMHPDNEKDQCCSKPIAHSKFNECGIEEQVKRLHQVVQDLRRSLQWSYDREQRLHTKVFALEHHQHAVNGDCMLRIEDINRGNNEISGGIASSIDLLA